MDIMVRQTTPQGIPALELVPQDSGPHPVVLLYHGYAGRKEFILAQGYNLARAGLHVVMPDAWGHGERATSAYCDFLEAVTRTVGEIEGILAASSASSTRSGAAPLRAGIAGYSMGGCITFAYLAAGGRGMAAAAPIIGSPDWVSVFETTDAQQHIAMVGETIGGMTPEAYREQARSLQPLFRLDTFPRIPLLVQNGEADTLIPVGPVRAFCDRLRSRYTAQEMLQFIGYPGIGHADTVEMNLQMASWFRTHLSAGG